MYVYVYVFVCFGCTYRAELYPNYAFTTCIVRLKFMQSFLPGRHVVPVRSATHNVGFLLDGGVDGWQWLGGTSCADVLDSSVWTRTLRQRAGAARVSALSVFRCRPSYQGPFFGFRFLFVVFACLHALAYTYMPESM